MVYLAVEVSASHVGNHIVLGVFATREEAIDRCERIYGLSGELEWGVDYNRLREFAVDPKDTDRVFTVIELLEGESRHIVL